MFTAKKKKVHLISSPNLISFSRRLHLVHLRHSSWTLTRSNIWLYQGWEQSVKHFMLLKEARNVRSTGHECPCSESRINLNLRCKANPATSQPSLRCVPTILGFHSQKPPPSPKQQASHMACDTTGHQRCLASGMPSDTDCGHDFGPFQAVLHSSTGGVYPVFVDGKAIGPGMLTLLLGCATRELWDTLGSDFILNIACQGIGVDEHELVTSEELDLISQFAALEQERTRCSSESCITEEQREKRPEKRA